LLRKQSETVLAHLTPVTMTFNPVTLLRVPLLPRTNVWTKFEEGRSRHSPVIDQKRKRLTFAKQYYIPSLLH